MNEWIESRQLDRYMHTNTNTTGVAEFLKDLNKLFRMNAITGTMNKWANAHVRTRLIIHSFIHLFICSVNQQNKRMAGRVNEWTITGDYTMESQKKEWLEQTNEPAIKLMNCNERKEGMNVRMNDSCSKRIMDALMCSPIINAAFRLSKCDLNCSVECKYRIDSWWVNVSPLTRDV